MGSESSVVNVDVLIIGAGPAGASTAAFLGRFGLNVLMISRHRGTAHTPRAHITNQRTMEALRDAGLEGQALAAGSPGSDISHWFWLRSMAGEEIARAWAWGNDPTRANDYLTASPCSMIDLPQTKLEPILVNEATRLGATVRFGWELQDFDQDDDGVTARITDRMTGQTTTIRAKYMVGADGARSKLVEQLGLPLAGRHGLGKVYNVFCDMDLSAHVKHRKASLYHVVQPVASAWGATATWRMVRPWDQWLVGMVLPPNFEGNQPTEDEFAQRLRETAGVFDQPIRIREISEWHINDVTAEHYSKGRVHCLGDAVHRHPPANALGSNTCVQDGFNLAWKLALVLQGKAHPSLLDSFNTERQPVGKQIVARANKSMGEAIQMMGMLGGAPGAQKTDEDLSAFLQTEQGLNMLRTGFADVAYNGSAHGVEMTRFYQSDAVIADGTPPTPERDPELYHQISTVPGSVLPHAWLVKREPSPLVSTLDVVGKGSFAVLSGHGGEAWRDAADAVSKELGIDIKVTLIGPFLDYEDPYHDWYRQREIDENGCLLVRPDHIIGWRAASLPSDPAAALRSALRSILGWDKG